MHTTPVSHQTGTELVTASRAHDRSSQSLVLVAPTATGDRDRPVVSNEHKRESLEMRRTTGTASTVLFNSPNLPPPFTVTTSSCNMIQIHPSIDHLHLQEFEGPTVHEAVFDAEKLMPLDLNHVAMGCVLHESEGSTVPDEAMFDADKLAPLDSNNTAISCEEDCDWYDISHTVANAAAATFQHTAESESASDLDFESELLVAAMMDDYIEWPDEDSE
ncbi:hypothetical protein BD769DRAFT_1390798 [Suillus cothurnatus]|nr:hypothetical protein BD769DRAFT_1390798 [Suillus cothurnatus]